jgi:hypothetical protein
MANERSLQAVADADLLRRLAQLLEDSRHAEADIVAHIAEVDGRGLYAREACPSMYSYCTDVLHFSEAEAYLRITVARAAREHPVLLDMLADGRLHLSGIVRLVPYLTPENRDILLERATYRSKREILELVAGLFPRPDAPSRMRKLPPPRAATPASSPSAQGSRAEGSVLGPDGVAPSPPATPVPTALVVPLAPARYKVQFTATAALHDKLERLRALMRSKVPDGDLAAIIEEAVSQTLERLEARRFGATKSPRTPSALAGKTGSRHIPAAVKRVVSEREGRRCGYRDRQGRRCTAQAGLEYHHRLPFSFGGDHGPDNIRLLCRVHHALPSEHDFGSSRIAARRRHADRGRTPHSR